MTELGIHAFNAGISGHVVAPDLGSSGTTVTTRNMGLGDDMGPGVRLQSGFLDGFVLDAYQLSQNGYGSVEVDGFDVPIDNADLEILVGRMAWRRRLVGGDTTGLGFQAGLVPVDYRLSLQMAGDPEPIDFTAPIPMAGLVLGIATPAPEGSNVHMLRGEISAMGMRGSYGDASGAFLDAEARVIFRPWRLCSFWAGWRHTSLDGNLDLGDLGSNIDVDLLIEGITFEVSIGF